MPSAQGCAPWRQAEGVDCNGENLVAGAPPQARRNSIVELHEDDERDAAIGTNDAKRSADSIE